MQKVAQFKTRNPVVYASAMAGKPISELRLIDPDVEFIEMEKEMSHTKIERRLSWRANWSSYGILWQTCERNRVRNPVHTYRSAIQQIIAMADKHKNAYIRAIQGLEASAVDAESNYNELTTALGYFLERLKGVEAQRE